MILKTDISLERYEYAKKIKDDPGVVYLSRKLECTYVEAGEVVYETGKFLGIIEMKPSKLALLCINCIDLSKRVREEICKEIPF